MRQFCDSIWRWKKLQRYQKQLASVYNAVRIGPDPINCPWNIIRNMENCNWCSWKVNEVDKSKCRYYQINAYIDTLTWMVGWRWNDGRNTRESQVFCLHFILSGSVPWSPTPMHMNGTHFVQRWWIFGYIN